MEIAKKTFWVLLNSLLLLIVSFSVGLFIDKNINKNIVPSSFGVVPLLVDSGSMEPYLKTGSLILVKKTKVNLLNEGDVISFYEDTTGNIITHRIVNITPENDNFYIETKGDANNTKDNIVLTKDNIIGKVFFRNFILGQIFSNFKFLFSLLCITLSIYLFKSNNSFNKKNI